MARKASRKPGAARAPPAARSARGGLGTQVATGAALVAILAAAWFMLAVPPPSPVKESSSGGSSGEDAESIIEYDFSSDDDGDGAASGQHRDSKQQQQPPATCTDLVARAARASQAGHVQQAIDLLIDCANLNPDDAASHWNVGLLLGRVKSYEDALSWLEQGLRLDPHNIRYWRQFARTAGEGHYFDRSIWGYERALEETLHLDENSWKTTMLAMVDKPREDFVWIRDEGPEAIRGVQLVLDAYLRARWLLEAEAAFTMLANVRHEDPRVQTKFADFLIGSGAFARGFRAFVDNLKARYGLEYPDSDSNQAVWNATYVLLGAGLQSHVVNMGRNVLLARDKYELDLIGKRCDDPSLVAAFGRPTVPAQQLVHTLVRCILHQQILDQLQEHKAQINEANSYGFGLIHDAAALGSLPFLDAVLQLVPHVDLQNSIEQTPLHIAASRGHAEVAKQLIAYGCPLDAQDALGRTAFDLACAHDWSLGTMAEVFGAKAGDCVVKPDLFRRSKFPSPPPPVGGGWQSQPHPMNIQRCDIDIRDNLGAEEFLADYLSIGKPVLIKRALKGKHGAHAQQRWERFAFGSTYGHLKFHAATIPYARAFGLGDEAVVLSDFLNTMHEQGEEEPLYIFESLAPSSALARECITPDVVSPEQVDIIPQNLQFHLGPANSGSPIHFHRAAWNVLVHGRKRWVLLPPGKALYSKKHITKWLRDDLGAAAQSGPVLECVQESGDLLYVPQAWGHGVLNLADSIGYASEFIFGGDEFSL